jgi:hypothetical protein
MATVVRLMMERPLLIKRKNATDKVWQITGVGEDGVSVGNLFVSFDELIEDWSMAGYGVCGTVEVHI